MFAHRAIESAKKRFKFVFFCEHSYPRIYPIFSIIVSTCSVHHELRFPIKMGQVKHCQPPRYCSWIMFLKLVCL